MQPFGVARGPIGEQLYTGFGEPTAAEIMWRREGREWPPVLPTAEVQPAPLTQIVQAEGAIALGPTVEAPQS